MQQLIKLPILKSFEQAHAFILLNGEVWCTGLESNGMLENEDGKICTYFAKQGYEVPDSNWQECDFVDKEIRAELCEYAKDLI